MTWQSIVAWCKAHWEFLGGLVVGVLLGHFV